MKVLHPKISVCAAVSVLTFALGTASAFAQFTDLTTAVQPWQGSGVQEIAFDGTSTIGIINNDCLLKTTSDLVTFTDRSIPLACNGVTYALATNGTAWAIGGSSIFKTTTNLTNFTDTYSSVGISTTNDIEVNGTTWAMVGNLGKLKTTTNLINFSDRSSALNAGTATLTVVQSDGTTWAIGGIGLLKTTTDFVDFSDRTAALNFGSDSISAIEPNGGIWVFGGSLGKLKTTTNFVDFSDRTSALNFSAKKINSIGFDGTVWAVAGQSGKLKTTTDFVNFSDRTSDLNANSDTLYSVLHDGARWWVGGFNTIKTTTNFVSFTSLSRQASIGSLAAYSAATDGTTWVVGGQNGEFHTTTSFSSSFIDRTSSLGFGGGSNDTIYSIATDDATWAIGGVSNSIGTLKTTSDFVNYSDRTSALDIGASFLVIAVSNVKGTGRKTHTTNSGSFTPAANAASSDNAYASTTSVGTQHTFGTYSFGLGGGETIRGIAVSVEGKRTSPAGTQTSKTAVFSNNDATSTWTTPTGGDASDNVYATGTNGQIELLYQAAPSLWFPSGSTINGIVVGAEAYQSTGGASIRLDVALSSTGCAGAFTAVNSTPTLGLGDPNNTTTSTAGTSSDLWGRTWSTSDFGPGIFCGQFTAVKVGGGAPPTASLDSAAATIYYTPPASANATFQVELLKGGVPTAAKSTYYLGGSDTTQVVGGQTDLWGTTWVPSDFNSGNFQVRVTSASDGGSITSWDLDTLSVNVFYDNPNKLWAIGGDTALKTTTDLINFSDRTSAAGMSGVGVIKTDGTVWAIAGASKFKTTTDFINFSDRSSALNFIPSHIATDTTTWAFANSAGELKITTDFVNYTSRTNEASFGGVVEAVEYSKGTWMFAASYTFKTTNDWENFMDRTTAVGFNASFTTIRTIAAWDGTMLIAGDEHFVVTNNTSPLAVELVAFEARGYDGEVQLSWQTGSELDNVGFNLYRAKAGADRWTLLTSRPISGLNTSSVGGKYLYRDWDVEDGKTYYYYLEDIDFSGEGTLHGPVNARPMGDLGAAPTMTEEEQATYAAVVFSTQLSPGENASELGPSALGSVSVVSSSANETVLDLRIPEGTLVSNGDGTHKIEIPTFGQLSLPNRPVVPYRALLVGIPCRQIASSSITVLDEETRNDVHLAIGALTEVHDADGNVVQPFSEGVDLQSGQLVEVPGQWATTNGIYPGASVGVGTPSCVSDSDGMLTLELTPVRYDASAHSTREARHVQVRLVYGESLSPAPWVPTEEVQVRLAEDSESLKVGITRSGLHRIPNLSSYGSRFRPENVCLYRNGRAVPYVWEDTDSLIFYGAYEPTRQSAESVYWIARNGDQDCSSSPVSGAPTSSTPASLWTKVHAEVNRLYVPSFPGDDETDRFYWDNTYWIPAAPPTRPNSIAKTLLATLSLEAVNTAATAPAKLRYEVQTLLEDPGHNPDHHVRAYLNGNWIDEFYAEGSVPVIREVEMASALLLEGANRFELQEVGDVNHRYTSSYLNFVDVTYPRTSGWNGVGELLLTFQTSGTAALTGLPPNATIEVWDVTAPRLARKLTGIGADSSGNLRFSAKAGHAYLLSSEASLPGRIWGNTPSRLRALSPTATVYLTHADFRPAAERLAAYRRSQGLRVSVVDVEEVYDEYGNGDVSDRAISSFVQDWGRRLQRDFSLLLFGDTTTDPHNYLGHNSKNYVPTHLHWLWVSETGSDQRLAYGDSPAFNGPIRIGRLPVQTLAEAQRIVDKIVDYEVTDTGENWTKAIALVADKPTLAWEQLFETFTNDLAQSIPDPLTSQVDLLGVLGSAQTRQNVQTRFNGGSLFINFLGHGYYDGWGSGYYADWGNVTPVLTGADVPLLTNIDRLPIVTALNCLNGYYIDSRVSALSETMLRSGAGGAVAYLSSSGLNTAESLTLFGENFYRNVTTESPVSLGHAFSKEKARLGSQVEDAEQLIDTLHLFGDPDLKIPGISPVSTQLPSSVVDLDTTGSGPTEMALGSTSPTSSEPPKTSEGCGRTSASSTLLLVSIFITAVFGRRIRPWPGFAHKAGPSDLL